MKIGEERERKKTSELMVKLNLETYSLPAQNSSNLFAIFSSQTLIRIKELIYCFFEKPINLE
jgi:hypothetical protein